MAKQITPTPPLKEQAAIDYEFKPFDCGNDDLNGFLLQDYWMMRNSR